MIKPTLEDYKVFEIDGKFYIEYEEKTLASFDTRKDALKAAYLFYKIGFAYAALQSIETGTDDEFLDGIFAGLSIHPIKKVCKIALSSLDTIDDLMLKQ